MKRSEMANKIQILLESRGYAGNSDDGEAVVTLIESLGMVPPLNENWMSMDECVDFYGPSWENDVNTYPRKNVHRWEPEDEKI
jgi:hypothetical protein